MRRRTAILWGLGAVQLAAAAFAYVAMVAIVLDTPHAWLRLGLLASLVVAVSGVVGCLLQDVVPPVAFSVCLAFWTGLFLLPLRIFGCRFGRCGKISTGNETFAESPLPEQPGRLPCI